MPQIISGKEGEEIAIALLKSKGYRILAVNWRFKHLEIDIISQIKDVLVFVEVKSRGSDVFGTPESFVNKAKQQKLIRAAHEYIKQNDIQLECRFDIVAVTVSGNKTEHIEQAFYPAMK